MNSLTNLLYFFCPRAEMHLEFVFRLFFGFSPQGPKGPGPLLRAEVFATHSGLSREDLEAATARGLG